MEFSSAFSSVCIITDTATEINCSVGKKLFFLSHTADVDFSGRMLYNGINIFAKADFL